MRIRRVCGTAVAGLLLTGFVGGPAATAQTSTKTPETYVGSAAGQALHLKVAAIDVSAGLSSVRVDSTLKALAESAGVLNIPALGGSNAGKVEVSGDGTKQAVLDKCVTPAVPAPLDTVITLGAACSSSLAEVVGGNPHALGVGSVFSLDVNAQTVLGEIPLSELSPILGPLFGGLDQLNDALAAEGFPDLALTDTLSDTLTRLQSVKTLDVRLGGSRSETTVDGTKVIAVTKTQAGVIALFPLGDALPTATGVTLKPLVEIEIGSATATAVYDRATGKSTPSFDPAIVTIRVNTPTTDSLSSVITGFTPQEIQINPNLTPSGVPGLSSLPAALVTQCADAANEFCVLPGTPLETRIAVASGRVVNNADGTVGAIADAVKVHALRNIGDVVAQLDGGILLEVAHAEAGVGGKPAESITVAVPEIPRELPRTGGTPWLPAVAILGVGLAFAARRTLAKANAS